MEIRLFVPLQLHNSNKMKRNEKKAFAGIFWWNENILIKITDYASFHVAYHIPQRRIKEHTTLNANRIACFFSLFLYLLKWLLLKFAFMSRFKTINIQRCYWRELQSKFHISTLNKSSIKKNTHTKQKSRWKWDNVQHSSPAYQHLNDIIMTLMMLINTQLNLYISII